MTKWQKVEEPFIYKTADLISQMVLSEDLERVFKQDPE